MDRFQDQANISKGEVILFVVFSKGLSDFIQNTILSSIRRCGVTTTICIALPRNALAEVKAAASEHYFRTSNLFFLKKSL